MSVRSKNAHWKLSEIRARHWLETGRRCCVADIPALLAELVQTTPAVLDRVAASLPKKFPAAVVEAIHAGMRCSADSLDRELRSA
jgi:serine/threonine-protein kinase HipA